MLEGSSTEEEVLQYDDAPTNMELATGAFASIHSRKNSDGTGITDRANMTGRIISQTSLLRRPSENTSNFAASVLSYKHAREPLQNT